MDFEQYQALEELAKEKNCKMAHIVFQALVNYCSALATGYEEIVVVEKE